MNKYPWFTHDNDAHEDEWCVWLLDKFGPAGYGRWWILMECYDRHGVGDVWVTTLDFIRKKLRSKSAESENYLRLISDSGKIVLKISGNNLRISIPGLRKRQAKLKSKHPSILPKEKSKLPKKEKEKEKENTDTDKGTPPVPLQPDLFKSNSTGVDNALKVLKKCSRIKLKDLNVLNTWSVSYPYVNLSQIIRDVDGWAVSKGVRRGPKGWTMTINRWLKKENEQHGQKKDAKGFAQPKGKDPFREGGW